MSLLQNRGTVLLITIFALGLFIAVAVWNPQGSLAERGLLRPSPAFVTLRPGEYVTERASLTAKPMRLKGLVSKAFAVLLAERLGILFMDPFPANFTPEGENPGVFLMSSSPDALFFQRHGRAGGYLVRIRERPQEPLWDAAEWTFLTQDPKNPTFSPPLQEFLNAFKKPDPAALYDRLLSEADPLSFVKGHVFKTLLGENPAPSGTVTLLWDTTRGRWEWVAGELKLASGSELDGHPDLFFDEIFRNILLIPEIAVLKNMVLAELVREDALIEEWKKVLQKFGIDPDEPVIQSVEASLAARFKKIRKALADTHLEAVLSPSPDGRHAALRLRVSGKSETFLKGLYLKTPETLDPEGTYRLIWDKNADGIAGPEEPSFTGRVSGPDTLNFKTQLFLSPLRKNQRFQFAPAALPRDYHFLVNVSHIRDILPENENLLAENLSAAPLLPVLNEEDFDRLFSERVRRGAPHSFLTLPALTPGVREKLVLEFGEGIHILRNDVIIRRDELMIVRPGAELKLAEGVSIICDGRLEMRGHENNPIRISALQPGKPWGAVVLRGRRLGRPLSLLEYVTLEGGSSARSRGVVYTGALSVFDTDVILRHVRFIQNTGEDALNARYSDPVVENCVFDQNAGDGVDFDFSRGVIQDSTFRLNADDGIDLSYSETHILRNRISHSGDKGISVGEKSIPLIEHTHIEGSPIGVAVKDLSRAVIRYSHFEKNEKAVSLYQKKSTFGPGDVLIQDTLFNENDIDEHR